MLLGVSLMELKRNKEAQAAFEAAAKDPRVAGVANLWSSVAGG
jgi:hypothetical protein